MMFENGLHAKFRPYHRKRLKFAFRSNFEFWSYKKTPNLEALWTPGKTII